MSVRHISREIFRISIFVKIKPLKKSIQKSITFFSFGLKTVSSSGECRIKSADQA